jgi:hypothetical protein
MYKLPYQSQQNISVQQQLGEAFQAVKSVNDNLGAVQAVVLVSQEIKNVSENIGSISTVGESIDTVLRVDANRDNLAAVISNESNINTTASNIGSVNTVGENINAVIATPDLLIEAGNLSQTVRELIEFGTEQYMFIDVALGDRLTYGSLFNEADVYNVLLGKVYDGTATPEEALAVEELNQKFGLISGFGG